MSLDLNSDFYFSYTYNLTRSLQQNVAGGEGTFELQSKFMWNEYLLQPFLNQETVDWILPVIHGSFGQTSTQPDLLLSLFWLLH